MSWIKRIIDRWREFGTVQELKTSRSRIVTREEVGSILNKIIGKEK